MESSKNNRFKIVNLSRSITQDKEIANDEEEKIVVLDIETDNSEKDEKSSDSNYVYDLYYTNSDDFGDCLDDDKAEKYLR